MSEQLKQEVDTAEIDRLETETDVDSKTIGQDETELPESKLEDESGNEVKAEDTVYLGKASGTIITRNTVLISIWRIMCQKNGRLTLSLKQSGIC